MRDGSESRENNKLRTKQTVLYIQDCEWHFREQLYFSGVLPLVIA